MASGLTPKQAAFVKAYLSNGGNAYAAARAAGYAHPKAEGSRLLENAGIRQAVAAVLPETVLSDAERIVGEWKAVAFADQRELVAYHRGACRYCHGAGFRYQRTPAEREAALEAYDAQTAAARLGARSAKMLAAIPAFDELGGVGYDPRKPANPDCPECAGFGVGRVIVNDTRELSPYAAALYAGVKVTQNGLEVKTHDKATALAALAKFHKLAGHVPDAGDGAPGAQVHLHLHLVKALEGMTREEREQVRPLLMKLAGGSKA